MSSFKDTFGKSDGSEKNLRYDDAAFQYFFATVLIAIGVPLIMSLYRYIIELL
jgi:hypothetical protein